MLCVGVTPLIAVVCPNPATGFCSLPAGSLVLLGSFIFIRPA